MQKNEIEKIAENADLIIAGFSFTESDNGQIRILNLEKTSQAAVLNADGDMIETTMDDNTLSLVQAYYLDNKEFLEGDNA